MGAEVDKKINIWDNFFMPIEVADLLAIAPKFDDSGNIIKGTKLLGEQHSLNHGQEVSLPDINYSVWVSLFFFSFSFFISYFFFCKIYSFSSIFPIFWICILWFIIFLSFITSRFYLAVYTP